MKDRATGCGRRRLAVGACLVGLCASAKEFTGPDVWQIVNTNAVAAWNARQSKRASDDVAVWPGLVADRPKREVRLLAEAVGHPVGITAEFLLVGPLSDRAYESAAVTVAKPGEISRAVEKLGLSRGGGVGSRPFRFWPCGERVAVTVRRLDVPDAPERPIQSLIADENKENPLLGDGGLVFTGGRWGGEGAASACLTDTNMPSSVVSLYNEPGTVFDVPFQVGQSEGYGQRTLAEALPYGALLEIVVRPILPKDGKPRVWPVTVEAAPQDANVVLTVKGSDAAVLKKAAMADALKWLREQTEQGREPYVTLEMEDALPLPKAVDVARVFTMLDGKGIRLDGKPEKGLYPKAFLPQEKWRERKDRNPQPFELHVAKDAAGKISAKLVFIEEDWTVEGLDPKLTPKEYPFDKVEEFPALIEKTGGADSKVMLLFVFVPANATLGEFMPYVRSVSGRLPLVYVFGE